MNQVIPMRSNRKFKVHLPDKSSSYSKTMRSSQYIQRMPNFDQNMNYLFVFTDTTLTAKSFLLTIDHQDVIPSTFTGQILPTLLTAVHDEPVGHPVPIKAVVTAQLMSHIFKANFMSNLQEIKKKKNFFFLIYLTKAAI